MNYFKSLWRLTWPILFGQCSFMLVGVGDVYLASLYSSTALAIVGVANGLINPIFLSSLGLMMGISPALAIERGKNKDHQKTLGTLIAYSLITSLYFVGFGFCLLWILPYLDLNPQLSDGIMTYLEIVILSFPFAIVFQGLKEYWQSFEKVFIPNFINFLMVFCNLALGYELVINQSLGIQGLAWTTLFVRALSLVLILMMMPLRSRLQKVDFQLMKFIFKLSYPTAFMFFLEVSAFSLTSIWSGYLSINEAAGHNVTLTVGSLLFMFPLSLSSAVAVKVGVSYGAKKIVDLKAYIFSGLYSALLAAAFFVFLLLVYKKPLMGLFTQEPKVLIVASNLALYAAGFQIFDGIQALLAGVLRGLNGAHIVSRAALVSYWLIGLPMAYYLSFIQKKGVSGLWMGLVISLTVMAFFLSIAVVKQYNNVKKI